MKTTVLICATCLAMVVGATLSPRDDYQPIIDAKPFGDMAALAETNTASLVEQQKQKEEIAQKFRMCGITDMPDGSRKIAFLDETSGSVASYLLAVGETENGFTLVSADYDREYATLSKDGLTFTLGLGKGLIDAPPAETEALQPIAVQKIETSSAKVAPQTPVRGMSFKARLLKRQQEKEAAAKAAKANASAVEGDAVSKAKAALAEARRKQIERIKQGLAPTEPITLTPEEDAELEAAGVFGSHEPEPEQPLPEGSAPDVSDDQNQHLDDADYESQGM